MRERSVHGVARAAGLRGDDPDIPIAPDLRAVAIAQAGSVKRLKLRPLVEAALQVEARMAGARLKREAVEAAERDRAALTRQREEVARMRAEADQAEREARLIAGRDRGGLLLRRPERRPIRPVDELAAIAVARPMVGASPYPAVAVGSMIHSRYGP